DRIKVYLQPGTLVIDREEADPVLLSDVHCTNSELAGAFHRAAVVAIQRCYPGYDLTDTLQLDLNLRPIRVPDISNFFILHFATPQVAMSALPVINSDPRVRLAWIVVNSASYPVSTSPNDPHYDSLGPITQDAQWHLHNDGVRVKHDPGAPCGQAVAGRDIKAEEAWGMIGFGDPRATLAFVDTGIQGNFRDQYNAHGDLNNLIQLTQEQKEDLHRHPDYDWCHVHGTRMAGVAAARANNYEGVVGVCGDCRLLDIENAGCAADSCRLQVEGCASIDADTWDDKVLKALYYDDQWPGLPGRIVVFNSTFAYSGFPFELDQVASMWNVFLAGRAAFVASSADYVTTVPTTYYPANLPFVLGVGGANWEGKFWDWPVSSCYERINGTSIGPSQYPPEGSVVDLSAPASGTAATTDAKAGDQSEYTYTTLQCSAAAAQVTGAVGLLQSWALAPENNRGQSYAPVEEVIGLLQATARPYSNTPWEEPNRACQNCPAQYYGKGVLDLQKAAWFAQNWLYYDPLGNPDYPCTRTARQSGGDNDNWRFTLVRDFYITAGAHIGHWRQYLASADIHVPAVRYPDSQGELVWVAWPRPRASNTFCAWGYEQWPLSNHYDNFKLFLAEQGYHDCWMTKIDQETGAATINGYDYAKWNESTQAWEFLVPGSDITMKYQVMCNGPAASAEETPYGEGLNQRPRIRFAKATADGRWDVRYLLPAASRVKKTVVNVAGQRVREWEAQEESAGEHLLSWDGRDASGRQVNSGVYWFQIRNSLGRGTAKLVVIR
ncbi:MAG: hypothetical protein FJ280_23375, partial [Planctomycetes bacterium]|nr:hypothetical protein [Planctomycetota bacterium]